MSQVMQDQRLSEAMDAFYSLGQDVLEGFFDAPKPRQMVTEDTHDRAEAPE